MTNALPGSSIFYAMDPLDVKIARIRAGISQTEMAARVGVNQKTLSAYELGRRKFPLEVLQRVLEVLNQHTNKKEVKDVPSVFAASE